jgi:hypothetical protein
LDHGQTGSPSPPRVHTYVPLLLWAILSITGCVHTIHVNPLPSSPTSQPIPLSAQVVTRRVALSGADHMPGINQLRWPQADIRHALEEYVKRRETFAAVTTAPADLLLEIGPELSLKSRDRYWYRIRLQVDIKASGRLIKSYVADHEIEGSVVRWVTASDRVPIEAALQRALDDVFTQIETDRALFIAAKGG